MYRLVFLTIALVLSGFSLSAQNMPNEHMQGKVILKLKENISIPASVNQQIKSGNTSFGIAALDESLEKLKIKEIEQKFPRHSKPEFQSQMKNDFGSDVKTLENIYELNFDEKMPVRYVIRELRRNKAIEYVEPVYIQEAFDVPNDEYYVQQQFLPQIFASDAWDIAKGEDGEEVIIGICDSGTEWHHPDLVANLYQNLGEDADGDGSVIQFNEETQQWEIDPDDINGIDDDGNGYPDDFFGWNYVGAWDGTPDYDVDGSDINTHGTHVAGLAAATTNNETGVASISWNVKFMATKHSPNDNGRSVFYGYDGIVYLAENGADIINMSWGGGPFSLYQQEVIEYARSLGAILVAAAGNNNNSQAHYPSSYSGVVSVASVASNDVKAYYSTYGETVDISAPGGDRYQDGGLLATIPGHWYNKYQGTSMASPVAAGLFALVQSHFPEKSDDEIIKQIIGTTDDIYDENPGFENMLGSGRINALKALTEEPQYPAGLELTVMGYEVVVYDSEYDFYYETDVVFGGSEGIINILIKNNNNFYGQDESVFNVTSLNEDFNLYQTSFTKSLTPDGFTFLEIPFYTSEDIESGFHAIQITASDPDEEILYGEENFAEVFVNNSDILAWQPLLGGEDMSGEFFKEHYESLGFDVYLTDRVLPTFEGFEAIFLSFGSTTAPGFGSYWMKLYQTLEILEEYAYQYGEEAMIYFESQNFLTHYNPFIIDLTTTYPLFGIADAGYNEEESAILDNIFGSDDTPFEDLNFSSSQNNTYEMNYLTPAPEEWGVWADAALELEDFGTVAVGAINPLGNMIFTSSVAVSQFDDADCPNTKRNFMRLLDNAFELYAPLDIVIDNEVIACQNTPVELGLDDSDCGEYYPFVNIATGGSGYFDVEWTPHYGLDDPYSSNPVMLEPNVNRLYQVTVTDLLLGEEVTHDVQVNVNKGAKVRVPLIKMHSFGNPLNLNDQIISITGGVEPYLEYIWTKDNEIIEDPENEIPSMGISRYYLQVIDSEGCVSKTARMIVFVSFYKQFAENDVTVGENGTIVATAYPNPANSDINLLTVFESKTNAEVKIVDIEGNTLYTESKNSVEEINQTLNIEHLSAGTYFIKIESEFDSVVRKFVKQ